MTLTEFQELENLGNYTFGTYHNGTDVGHLITTECEYHPNTALLTTCLMFGTFLLAFGLRKFRASTFLSSKVRRTIGDFGVPIAIIIMVLAQLGATGVYTQKV